MYNIDKTLHIPAYVQLKRELMRQIQSGEFTPGQKIPSVRELINTSGLSHLTVARSIGELVKEGVLRSEKGKGTYVQGNAQDILHQLPRALHFALIYPFSDPAEVNPHKSPFTYEVVNGINEYVSSQSYSVVHLTADDYLAGRTAAPVDGAIFLVADSHQENAAQCAKLPLPLVMICQPDAHTDRNYIDSTNYEGGRSIAEHLLDLGHRRIAFLTSSSVAFAITLQERLRGFKDALSARGIPFDEDRFLVREESASKGYDDAKNLLRLPQRPTAIVTMNDLTALGVLRAALEEDLQVPRDLSVTGYMGVEVVSQTRPYLTTVDINMHQIGYEAALALDNLVSGKRAEPIQIRVPSRLIVRETTAPPPAAG